MSPRRLAPVALLAALALGLAACGGDDDEASTPAKTSTTTTAPCAVA